MFRGTTFLLDSNSRSLRTHTIHTSMVCMQASYSSLLRRAPPSLPQAVESEQRREAEARAEEVGPEFGAIVMMGTAVESATSGSTLSVLYAARQLVDAVLGSRLATQAHARLVAAQVCCYSWLGGAVQSIAKLAFPLAGWRCPKHNQVGFSIGCCASGVYSTTVKRSNRALCVRLCCA